MTEVKEVEQMKRQLVFYAPTKKTLNSNRMPNHVMVKSTIATYLRKMGQETGIKENYSEKIFERLESIVALEDMKSEKSRSRKRMNKAKEDEKTILKRMEEIEKQYNEQYTHPDNIIVPFLFNRFKIRVTVFSLTKGRIDPPNFYPTIKHLIDGLTDASWWKDDDFDHLKEISFVYGGVSEVKGEYKFVLDIEEVVED